MLEGFKNPYEKIKIELGEMNDGDLGVDAPTPEALNEMFGGLNKMMSTTEQSTQSESEQLNEKIKGITDSIARLNVEDGLASYRKLLEQLIKKLDANALEYYCSLIIKRIDFLSNLLDEEPLKKQIMPLKIMRSNVDMNVKNLREEAKLAESAAGSSQIATAIEEL